MKIEPLTLNQIHFNENYDSIIFFSWGLSSLLFHIISEHGKLTVNDQRLQSVTYRRAQKKWGSKWHAWNLIRVHLQKHII